MTNRTTRNSIDLAPGITLLKPQNDDRTTVVLVIKDGGKVEVWLQRKGVEWQ